jgi:hypothetical protein
MSTIALQCCPSCRRNVAAQALVCRACYTVLPRKKKEEPVPNTAPRRLLVGPGWIVTLVVFAAGLWWARIDLGLVSPDGPAESGDIAGAGFLLANGGSNANMASSDRTASHWSLLKKGGNCILNQGVRNVGNVAATRAAFLIQFYDFEGNAAGDTVQVAKRTAIPPEQDANFELVAQCPQIAVSAKVAILESIPATEPEPKLELLARTATDNWSASGKKTAAIVVEVADLSICTPPERCELKVTFDQNSEANYWFHRPKHSPALLLNENSILIGHLKAKRPATLHLDEELNGTTVPLTYRNVQEKDPPGYLERLWDLMPWQSGDKG